MRQIFLDKRSRVSKVQGPYLLHPNGKSTIGPFAGECPFQEGTGAGFRRRGRPPRYLPNFPPRAEGWRTGGRATTRPLPPLTSSACPSSRSKVTTHTHSSQAEKRAQGGAAARAPEDRTPRRSRGRRGPALDSESMAETAAAGSTLPGERPGGVAGETARRRWPPLT